MDAFTTAFLASVTAHLTNQVLSATKRGLRRQLEGSEENKALKHCVQAGVAALLATAETESTEEIQHITDIFTRFSQEPDVGKELEVLLNGGSPDIHELRSLFEEAGYDAATLPGIDFEKGMTAFGAAFLTAATTEPVLQDTIQTNQLLIQTQIQHELLVAVRQIVDLVRQENLEDLTIRHGEVLGIVNGKEQIVYLAALKDIIQRNIVSDHLREAYLSHLFHSTAFVDLSGIDPKAACDSEAVLSLDAVYTSLLTLSMEERDRKKKAGTMDFDKSRFSALAHLDMYRHLVLLGEPGSGKTTFVNFVAMCLAGEIMGRPDANLSLLREPLPDDDGESQKETQPWNHGALLPVRIILRDFASRGLPSPGKRATAKHIWDFIEKELEEASIKNYTSKIQMDLLEQGGLILLDGLDEVPKAESRREQIKQAIEDFAGTYERCRILVTSRTYAYQEQAWRLKGFSEAILAPFSRGQIHRFIERWYTHVSRIRGFHISNAQGRATLLKLAIFESDRLYVLAERPLLLTLMTSLHAWRGGSLPEKREELYRDTVNLLLDRWESPKLLRDDKGNLTVPFPSLAEWLKMDREKVIDVLTGLAYQAHKAQPELQGTADILESDLVGGLMALSKNPDVRPARLIEYLSQRAGLLLPRGIGAYSFPHRTFQEYLAAWYLTHYDYPNKLAQLGRSDPDRWREVVLLAGAKAARGTSSALWSLVDALCYKDDYGAWGIEDIWGAHLAGLFIAETADLERVSEPNKKKIKHVQHGLIHILDNSILPVLERTTVGNSLSRLGDPRFRKNAWFLPDDPFLGFVEIPKGIFTMGSDGKADSEAFEDEAPQHKVEMPTFYIARYPVTVAQFKAFMEDTGHKPKNEDSLKGIDNHPIVWVEWYEALKYCEWLTEKLRGWKEIMEPFGSLLKKGAGEGPWVITLPSEAEWEKAARGTDGRIYPWGDKPDPNRANYYDTGIGATSAVGCFPSGKSPYECQDMAGNVWEWTRSIYKEYPYDPGEGREDLSAGQDVRRVIRGGAFNHNQ